MMNKKGLGPIAIIFIVGLVLAFLLGFVGTLKVTSIINSIPTWAWIGIGVLVLYLMLRKK